MKVLSATWIGYPYSLVTIEDAHSPYVVAYQYDEETQTWQSGAYFSNKFEAERYLAEKLD